MPESSMSQSTMSESITAEHAYTIGDCRPTANRDKQVLIEAITDRDDIPALLSDVTRALKK